MTGRRKGWKRSDKRWIDERGQEWDSRFEWQVFEALRNAGVDIRRCDKRDTIAYGTRVRGGSCLECGSDQVIQARAYTADLYVLGNQPFNPGLGYLLELKGYWQASKRTLFRSVAKQCANEGINLRIVFESGRRMRGTQLNGPEYVHKYCKNVVPGVYNKKTQEIIWHEQ